MAKERLRSAYGYQARRNQLLKTALLVVLAIVLCVSLVIVISGWRNRLGNEKKELLRLWDEGLYDKVFELSRAELENNPADYFLLTIHGFAAYQLAIAQINSFDTLTYVDECIWSLRKALQLRSGSNDGRVQYVLGKAYYHKGPGYEDLAIQRLEEARDLSYAAVDIPEHLGLLYAATQDYRASVEAFSLALNPPQESPTGVEEDGEAKIPPEHLLLAMARSYIALGEPENAVAYLVRCMEISRDSATIITVRLLLGDILAGNGKLDEAEAQYQAILNEDGENAEAHYQLGELYYARGNITRTRAELRSALKIDPAHELARARWAQLNP
jgi:tetratricopeptide (TPR) repeat protein